MSITNLLKSASIVTLGLFCGYYSVSYSNSAIKDFREPASTVVSKLGAEQVADQFLSFNIDLGEISTKDSDNSNIVIKITALKNLKDKVNFNWSLPSNVSLIAGAKTGNIGELRAGETSELKVTVKGFSKEKPNFINFELEGSTNKFQIRKKVLIASQLENAAEYKIHKSANSQTNDINTMNTRKKNKFSPENVVK